MISPQSNSCPTCGKELIGDGKGDDRAGSLTSFLLSDLSCTCRIDAGAQKPSKLCLRCNKVIPDVKRIGSLTAFFFKDIRCTCVGSDRGLQTRFNDGRLTVRRQQMRATAMARTQSALAADAAAFVELKIGDVIGGSYRLISLAGQGGMGSVYRAQHIGLNRQCAVKFLAPSMVSEETWRLFQKEAKIISSLTHSTICQIYDLGIHGRRLPFYAMDYIEGRTLDEVINRQGTLSVGATAELYIKVLDGLSYAHRRGVVHKDMKPSNIMLEKSADGQVQARILDFGISELSDIKDSGSRSKNKESAVIGSAHYMSPEQFSGRGVGKTSDIYSIGCSLFETLTGLPPFAGEEFRELEKEHITKAAPSLKKATGLSFAPEIEAIVAKCLEKQPDNRYQNASELMIDLQRLLEGKALQFADVAALSAGGAAVSGAGEGYGKSASPWLIRSLVAMGALVILGGAGYLILRLMVPQDGAGGSIGGKIADMPSFYKPKNEPGSETRSETDIGWKVEDVVAKVNDNLKTKRYDRGALGFVLGDRNQGGNNITDSFTFAQFPRVAPDQAVVLTVDGEGDYRSQFARLPKDKIIGVKILSNSDPNKQLAAIAEYFPNIKRIWLHTANEATGAILARFESLYALEISGAIALIEPLKLERGVEDLIIDGMSNFDFSPAASGKKVPVGRVMFKRCPINKQTMTSLLNSLDLQKVAFVNCMFKEGSFLLFLESKNRLEVSLVKAPVQTPNLTLVEMKDINNPHLTPQELTRLEKKIDLVWRESKK